MTSAIVRNAWSGLWCAGLALVVSTVCSAARAQVSAGDVGAQVLSYADFGRADILMSAAAIRQADGSGSVARISQELDISSTDPLLNPSGHGNRAVLSQRGDLNRARIVQNGSDNLVDASQAGVDNRLDVTQTGINNSLVARQNGNGNRITLTQEGGNVANLTETGDNNSITVQQVVGGPSVSINLVGSGYTITIRQ